MLISARARLGHGRPARPSRRGWPRPDVRSKTPTPACPGRSQSPSSAAPTPASRSLINAILGETARSFARSPAPRATPSTSVTTDDGRFRLIDTAGMRKASKVTGVEYYAYLRSVQSLDRAHVAVIVVDADQALRRARSLHRLRGYPAHCATVIAVNKTDLGEDRNHDEIAGIEEPVASSAPPGDPISGVTRHGSASSSASGPLSKPRYNAISTGSSTDPWPTWRERSTPRARQAPPDGLHRPDGTAPPRFAFENTIVRLSRATTATSSRTGCGRTSACKEPR